MSTNATASGRVREVCTMFGLGVRAEDPRRVSRAQAGAAMLAGVVRPGMVGLVTGPSGSGKSSIVSALRGRLGALGARVVAAPRAVHPRLARVCVIDAIRRPVDEALRVLARAGLAEARVAITPIGMLSDGQRSRLRVAMAMDRAVRCGAWVLIDELATGLDRATACGLCLTLGRWARSARVPVVAASACDELIEPLAPDVVLDQPLAGEPTLIGPARFGARRSA